MKITSIKSIEPKLSRCISVDKPDKLFAVGEGGQLLSHNSVAQQNIIISCLLRPEHWILIGIDLKRVELTRYRDFGIKVATEVEDAVQFLRFAQAVMMKRYAKMEQLGVNDFLNLPNHGQALLVMIDEAGELLSPTGAKALADHTLVPNDNGRANLKEIQVGDTVYDNYGNPTTVTQKYTPKKQGKLKMTISGDSKEEFIAGEEHLWVVYYEHPNGTLAGPETVDTQYLHGFLQSEQAKPKDERITLKIKKG